MITTTLGPEKETIEDSVRGRARVIGATKEYLFVVLEAARPLSGGARFALAGVEEIVVGRGTERAATIDHTGGVGRLALRLPSELLSRLHVRLRRAPEGWLLEDGHSRNGSYLNGIRVARGVMSHDDVLEVGHAFLMIRKLPVRDGDAPPDLDSADLEREAPALRTLVPALAGRLDDLQRIASSSVSVLLTGETGTGKEVLARAVHQLSQRPGPFVAVNCSTLTEGLSESQLFGHVKGAFSGAVADTPGFVRAAQGGTLLLDEVGDLGVSAQGALLRVLQEHEVVPVGRVRPEKVDVRFIATTPRALSDAVGRDQFRSDLFARLSGYVHLMAPLRERREDLGLLVATLLRKAGVRDGDGARIAPETGLALVRHDWPLNVRELEQLLVRSWLLAEGGLMDAPVGAGEDVSARASDASHAGDARLPPEDQQLRGRVIEALRAARGNVAAAARMLAKGRIQTHRLIRRLKLDAKDYRS